MIDRLRRPELPVLARLARVVALGTALAASAAAAPQLDLPKKRRSAPPKSAPPVVQEDPATAKGGVPAKSTDTTNGGAAPAAGGDKPGAPPAAGSPAPGGAEVTPVVGPDGEPIGTRTTVRVNGLEPNAPAGRGTIDIQGGQSNRVPEGRVGVLPGIDLPGARRARGGAAAGASGGAPAGAASAPTGGASGSAPNGASDPAADPFAPVVPDARGAARVLLDRMTKVRRVTDSELDEIAQRLARLGDDGLEVARYALAQSEAPMITCGARALLEGGTGADADLVVRRLRGSIPRGAAPVVLDDLLELDPTRGTNELLVDLLAHDSGQVRRSARSALSDRLTSDDLTGLISVLALRSAEKRRGALEMIAKLEPDYAVDPLLSALDDRSTSVAKVAIEALARVEHSTVDVDLERRLFARGTLGVPEARALLAIVEREDRTGTPILSGAAVPMLVEGLRLPIPLVANASALGLAGIGFRSDSDEVSEWLDGPVPEQLVRAVAGVEFFDGFDLVREPAIRRLRQISGTNHGRDGDEWRRWWIDARPTFSATRVRIPVEPDDALRVLVQVHDPAYGAPVTLAGPGLAADDGFEEPEVGVTYYLFPEDARALLDLLATQGVFGAERLPGVRGTLGVGAKSLEVAIGPRRKAFRTGVDFEQRWFGAIVQRAYGLSRRYGWETCAVPDVHADRRAFFLERLEEWTANDDPTARGDGLEAAVFRHLAAVETAERGPGLVALFDLDTTMGVLGLDDVYPLMTLLEDESIYGQRAVEIVDLAQSAIGIEGDARESLSGTALDRALLLMDTVERTFGTGGLEGIESTLRRLDDTHVAEAAADTRVLRRVAAARVLGGYEPGRVGEDVVETLDRLARDADPDVRGAAMRALGGHGVTSARELFEERARSGSVADRAVAVEMLGRVGGPNALTLIVDALTAPDDRLHLPAARGLAALGTADAAPLLTSLLRSTSNEALRSVARDGLVALGAEAKRELLVGLRSTDERLRRTSALILGELLEPRAVPELGMLLTLDPTDRTVQDELRVLTCVDYGDESSPGASYLRFWEEAEQRDALSWFLAGATRRGLRPPARPDFEGAGTRDARAFCVAAQTGADAPFAERARRELGRMSGEDLGAVPATGLERRRWFERASELVERAPAEATPPAGTDAR
ncbi:MAG: HEAT repeat domain-containing protein [Planctomycetota bacterium]